MPKVILSPKRIEDPLLLKTVDVLAGALRAHPDALQYVQRLVAVGRLAAVDASMSKALLSRAAYLARSGGTSGIGSYYDSDHEMF